MVVALRSYTSAVDKILATENLTQEQREGSIKLISAMVTASNLAGAWKVGAESSVVIVALLMSAMIAVLNIALEWVVQLYENLPSFKGAQG